MSSRRSKKPAPQARPSEGAALRVAAATSGADDPGLAMRVLTFECALLLTLLTLVIVRLLLRAAYADSIVTVPIYIGAALAFWWATRLVFPASPQLRFEFAAANALATFLVLRPWFDGITLPKSNHWFLLGGAAIAVAWAGRLLHRREAPREAMLPALLLVFVVCTLPSLSSTVHLDETLRHLLLWAGYCCIFTVAANALRDPLALGVVLTALVLATIAEGAYAVVQIRYLLPQSRHLLEMNPELLEVYVGQSEMSAGLLHRLYANRAFGSFLFPNALAAFLALALPAILGMLASRALLLRRLWKRAPAGASVSLSHEAGMDRTRRGLNAELSQATSVGVLTWLAALCICGAGYYVYLYQVRWYEPAFPQRYHATPILVRALPWLLYGGILPVLLGLFAHRTERRRGLAAYWACVQCLALCIAAALGGISLLLTFSRGAMLGLAVATALAVAVGWVSRRSLQSAAAAGAFLLCAGALIGAATADPPVPALGDDAVGVEAATAAVPDARAATDSGGFWMSRDDLASASTFRLRLGYWRVGWRMFRDHALTGTGFGTYGSLYPKYQTVAETDVRCAHNDYLQILSETGLVGALPFGLFVGALLLRLARGVWQAADLEGMLVRAGLLAGVAAFLVHCVVDFNLYNPGLAMLFFLVAGLACAVSASAAPLGPVTRRVPAGVATSIVMFVLVGFVAFGVERILPADRLVADYVRENARFRAAAQLLDSCDPHTAAPADTARARFDDVRSLIPQRQTLTSFGRIIVPRDESRRHWRPRGEGEPLTGNEVLLITDRPSAYKAVRQAVDYWISRAEQAERRYPYCTDLSLHLYRWYDTLLATETDPEARIALAARCRVNAERMVALSPEQGLSHRLLGDALWIEASMRSGERQIETFRAAVDSYQRATALYPSSHELANEYGDRMRQFAEALGKAGRHDESAELAAQAADQLARAARIPPRGDE